MEIRPLVKKRMTTKEVLAWYLSGPGPGVLLGAADLMKPVPEEWEALREKDLIK